MRNKSTKKNAAIKPLNENQLRRIVRKIIAESDDPLDHMIRRDNALFDEWEAAGDSTFSKEWHDARRQLAADREKWNAEKAARRENPRDIVQDLTQDIFRAAEALRAACGDEYECDDLLAQLDQWCDRLDDFRRLI
jgi:hypothetical protein